ncbi:hypothetical protein MTQ61_08070, partial [Escherichia coli]|nr:hypothetical protein [Escherichia coli]
CPLTDFGGKTSIFSHPVYLFLRKFSLQDSRGGSSRIRKKTSQIEVKLTVWTMSGKPNGQYGT